MNKKRDGLNFFNRMEKMKQEKDEKKRLVNLLEIFKDARLHHENWDEKRKWKK